jgi:PmbA protein
LLRFLLRPANARAIQQQQCFWAGLRDKQAFSPKLTLHDEPLIKGGLASRLFDDEGIAARSLPIIEAGRIRNFYVDTYYGSKADMKPTTGSPSNQIVTPGERSFPELLGSAKSGILVTRWLGGNSDSTTGDFSVGCQGHLIEKGKIGAPVGEMNVTGNLAELFSNLVEVGNDPWKYSSLRAPTLVFENVQFSGA